MGASQRRKGHDWEREVARMLRAIYPGARRGWQSRGGGAEEADVAGTPFHVECKCGARPDVWSAMRQAGDDAKPGYAPLVVAKKDREPPVAVMLLEDFLDLLREREELASGKKI